MFLKIPRIKLLKFKLKPWFHPSSAVVSLASRLSSHLNVSTWKTEILTIPEKIIGHYLKKKLNEFIQKIRLDQHLGNSNAH